MAHRGWMRSVGQTTHDGGTRRPTKPTPNAPFVRQTEWSICQDTIGSRVGRRAHVVRQRHGQGQRPHATGAEPRREEGQTVSLCVVSVCLCAVCLCFVRRTSDLAELLRASSPCVCNMCVQQQPKKIKQKNLRGAPPRSWAPSCVSFPFPCVLPVSRVSRASPRRPPVCVDSPKEGGGL